MLEFQDCNGFPMVDFINKTPSELVYKTSADKFIHQFRFAIMFCIFASILLIASFLGEEHSPIVIIPIMILLSASFVLIMIAFKWTYTFNKTNKSIHLKKDYLFNRTEHYKYRFKDISEFTVEKIRIPTRNSAYQIYDYVAFFIIHNEKYEFARSKDKAKAQLRADSLIQFINDESR